MSKPLPQIFLSYGWAALNFGTHFKEAELIVGGPQYMIGSWMLLGNNNAYHHVIGEETQEHTRFLDSYLKNKLFADKAASRRTVHIHYSTEEWHYETHFKYLLEDLKSAGYTLDEEAVAYGDHQELTYYFPPFLLKTLKEIMR